MSAASSSISSGTGPYQLCLIRERAQWNKFVQGHPYGHVLQSWEWGEFKAHSGWFPLRAALRQAETGRIVAAAQILRRGVPHVPLQAGHFAYLPKGPVLDWAQPASGHLCHIFLTQLDALLQQQGAIALRIEPVLPVGTPESAPAVALLTDWSTYTVSPLQPLRTIILDLSPDEEMLLARMKEKWRYNVRLAARKGVTVRVANSSDDVRAWYELLRVTSERDHFGIHTLDYYLQAWRHLNSAGWADLLLAEYQGQLLAGIFVTSFGAEAIYLYGASSNEQRHLMPNYLLQWEAIRRARRVGAARYDLWGIPASDDEEEAMAGVYRFKRGWGGKIVTFVGAFEKTYHPFAMQLARRWFPLTS